MFSHILTSSRPSSKKIKKANKYFARKLDFKDLKLPIKVRNIQKIEQQNSIGISVFGYKNKGKHPA